MVRPKSRRTSVVTTERINGRPIEPGSSGFLRGVEYKVIGIIMTKLCLRCRFPISERRIATSDGAVTIVNL